jgi:hypothetical protein
VWSLPPRQLPVPGVESVDAGVTFGAHRLSQPRDVSIAQERPMPIVKARTNRVRSVKHYCRLQEPNRDTLVLYARFID